MKKLTAMILALFLLTLAACAPKGESGALTGSAADVFASVAENADYPKDSMPATGEDALTADNASTIGLDAAMLGDGVEEGVISYAMISSVAHMTAMLKCKDAAAAADAAASIAGGFDVHRWVCVMPETAFVAVSGQYVFFVASWADYADALYGSFSALAGEGVVRTDIETGF